MRTLIDFVEDLVTEGRTDEQVHAVAIGTSKDLKEVKQVLKEVRKRLKTHNKTRR